MRARLPGDIALALRMLRDADPDGVRIKDVGVRIAEHSGEEPAVRHARRASQAVERLLVRGLAERGNWRDPVRITDAGRAEDAFDVALVSVLERLPEGTVEPGQPAPLPRAGYRQLESNYRELWSTYRAAAEMLVPERREALRLALLAQGWAVYDEWLREMWPAMFPAELAWFHREAWEWALSIEADRSPAPDSLALILARGAAKSATAEGIAVLCGFRRTRRYVVYVSGTQYLADGHVESIGALLESPTLAEVDPELADRAVDKYGQSRGWRRNRLVTASGLVVDALGLDVGARGIRFEEARPDLIILDDVDTEHDSPAIVRKKIDTITRRILPAGDQNRLAVLAVQNVIHPESVFARLVSDGSQGKVEPADFLLSRRTIGPIPAVEGLEVELPSVAGEPIRVTGGEPTWPGGLDLQACEAAINRFGLASFLREAQHEEPDLRGGLFDHVEFVRCRADEVPELRWVVATVDPAVSSTDRSDSMGIIVDGMEEGGNRIFRLFAWEQITSPLEAVKLAIRHGSRWGAEWLQIETDQGGDTWQSVYREAVDALREEGLWAGEDPPPVPRFHAEKAGSTGLAKAERAARMVVDYELRRFVHVEGPHRVLETALRRFPRYKPFDLVDACLAPGTLVSTERGAVPVEDVLVGDRVWTRLGWRPVTWAGPTRRDAEVVELVTEGGHRVVCTPDHRVWTVERGWVQAQACAGLTVGIGPCASPSAGNPPGFAGSRVQTVRPIGVVPVVYDLTVEEAHEFVAGGVLVHNCYWGWAFLSEKAGEPAERRRFSAKRPRGVPGRSGAQRMGASRRGVGAGAR